jgi:hypothetical protein
MYILVYIHMYHISAVDSFQCRDVGWGLLAQPYMLLQLAIAAQHFGIPFYVAAPTTTIDLSTRYLIQKLVRSSLSSGADCIYD